MKIAGKVQKVWKSLNRRERRVLRCHAKQSPDAGLRLRCKIVLSLVQDNKPSEIYRAMQCSSSQVYRVAHRFIDDGLKGLADRREDNGECKVTEEYEWHVLIAVACSPQDYGYRRPTWTQELLLLVLEKQTGIGISTTTLSRLLRRHRVRLGRPKPIVRCPWKKSRRQRRLRALRRLIREVPDDEVVLYVDEVDIHLNPKIGHDWMLRGMQKTALTPGKNEKRYLAGGLDARTGRLTWVEADHKNSDLFIEQLWQLVQDHYPKAKRIHLILDNFRIHKSQRTQLALKGIGGKVQLHFLPPYCPDENRIERIWKDLHDNVTRNHKCKTIKELMNEVRAYLKRRQETLRHGYATMVAA